MEAFLKIQLLVALVKEARASPIPSPRYARYIDICRRHAEILKGCVRDLPTFPPSINAGISPVFFLSR